MKKAETSKERQRVVLEEIGIQVAPPSLTQLDNLIEGKTSTDELKTEMGIEPSTEPPVETPVIDTKPDETVLTEEQRQEKAKERIDGSVKELYAYEVELMASLGALKQEAIDEYHALPEAEQTHDGKVRIGYKYLNRCYDLEVEADSRVKAILDRLRSDLKALGQGTEIADSLWNSYCEEKVTAKEYYLSKYL